MPKSGPIILIEDDSDDQYFISTAIQQLGLKNAIRIFNNGQAALEYLLETSDRPFIILCDINMPLMNGLELRVAINRNE